MKSGVLRLVYGSGIRFHCLISDTLLLFTFVRISNQTDKLKSF